MQRYGMAIGLAAATALGWATSGPAKADSDAIIGTWTTQERDSRIRVAPCAGKAYCATIVWAKKPGTDEHNPQPALRSRSIVGVQLTRDMRPDQKGAWSGSIYNPDDGKTYSASMALKTANALEVSGCVLGGLICGSDTWTRDGEDTASAGPPPRR